MLATARSLGWASLLAASLSFSVVCYAIAASEEAEQRYQDAFDAMIEDLANPELSFEYVQAAIEVGDVRGAISALERLLLLNPNLSNLKLELGVLYLRVGSPDLARTLISQALESPDIPELVRIRAEEFLARAEAGAERHRLSGRVFIGGRFETNPEANPDSRGALAFDTPVELDEDDTEDPDFSVVFSTELQHVFDLGNQSGDTLETNIGTFVSRYADTSKINLTGITVDSGPKIYVGEVLSPLFAIRPHLTASEVLLGDEQFLLALGGGIEIEKFLSRRLRVGASGVIEHQNYDNVDQTPDASDRTGQFYSGTIAINYQLLPRTVTSLRGFYSRRKSDQDWESFHEPGVAVGLLQTVDAPFGLTERPWLLDLVLAYRRTEYDEPDPVISTTREENDDRYDISANATVPVTESIDSVLSLRYTYNNSNIPQDTFDNFSVMLGAAYNF